MSKYVDGLDVALAALAKLADATVQEAALLAGAEVVRAEGADRAPRITGALAASLYTVTKSTSGYAEAAARSAGLGDSGYALAEPVTARQGEAKIAAAAIYAPMIEYREQPFLRPALDGSHNEITLAMEKTVRAAHKALE